MKPAPPVMHTRLFVRAMRKPLSVMTGSGLGDFGGRPAAERGFLPQRKQFIHRNTAADEQRELLAGTLERGDDHQVVVDLIVLTQRPDRHAEESVTAVDIENRDRLEAVLLQTEVRELRRLAAA